MTKDEKSLFSRFHFPFRRKKTKEAKITPNPTHFSSSFSKDDKNQIIQNVQKPTENLSLERKETEKTKTKKENTKKEEENTKREEENTKNEKVGVRASSEFVSNSFKLRPKRVEKEIFRHSSSFGTSEIPKAYPLRFSSVVETSTDAVCHSINTVVNSRTAENFLNHLKRGEIQKDERALKSIPVVYRGLVKERARAFEDKIIKNRQNEGRGGVSEKECSRKSGQLVSLTNLNVESNSFHTPFSRYHPHHLHKKIFLESMSRETFSSKDFLIDDEYSDQPELTLNSLLESPSEKNVREEESVSGLQDIFNKSPSIRAKTSIDNQLQSLENFLRESGPEISVDKHRNYGTNKFLSRSHFTSGNNVTSYTTTNNNNNNTVSNNKINKQSLTGVKKYNSEKNNGLECLCSHDLLSKNLTQDVLTIKTYLLRLKRTLAENTAHPLPLSSSTRSYLPDNESFLSSSTSSSSSQEEETLEALQNTISHLTKQNEEKDLTIRLLRRQLLQSPVRSSGKDICNAMTQTSKASRYMTGSLVSLSDYSSSLPNGSTSNQILQNIRCRGMSPHRNKILSSQDGTLRIPISNIQKNLFMKSS